MEKGKRNKMITGEKTKIRQKKEKFFFPDYQMTVEAENIKEAEKIVKESNK